MTEEELDAAAHELMQARGNSPLSRQPGQQYYEHMGGYSMHEMQGYNYPAAAIAAAPHTGGPYQKDDVDDDMVYVTAL